MSPKDAAVILAGAHADIRWMEVATAVVHRLCRRAATFTTDDVWALLDQVPGLATREHRAMGAVMVRAAREGWCRATDRTVNSAREVNHERPVRVWQSLLL